MSTNSFRSVIQNILNRWSALKMAVEHQMGGSSSYRKALDLWDQLDQLFSSGRNIDYFDLDDFLVEYMDSEFNIMLEDESSDEIARTLVNLFEIFKRAGVQTVNQEISSMPVCAIWLDINQQPVVQKSVVDSESSGESEEEVQNDEWTTVSYKRR